MRQLRKEFDMQKRAFSEYQRELYGIRQQERKEQRQALQEEKIRRQA